MNEPVTFGRWMKRLRAELDLTQERLGEQVGCAAQTIRSFESGIRRPSRELAERLADALDVSPEQRAGFVRLARTPLAPSPAYLYDHADAAPSPSSAARRTALPVAPTPLIGRESERADLARRLQDPACRLVTLVGPGGIGKSRLALQIAGELAPAFADGAAFVALAPVAAAETVPAAIAEALDLSLASGNAPSDQLLATLRERELLLVLDNLEHLLDATPLFAAILQQAPGVRLLGTSRERLRLQSEWAVELGGLSLPRGHSSADIERSDAAQLFLERARQVAGGLALTPANQADVARICRLLEGAPLAIELAATWARALSCAEIGDEIARNLDFLTHTDRDAPPRHQSMRVVIDYSWRLLTADEQHVLARLSTFRGGCRRAAAEAVASELKIENGKLRIDGPPTLNSQFSILHLLAALIDKSLLRRMADADGTPRYTMHELVRQYAAARLAEQAGEPARTQERHAAYYAALLHARLPALRGAGRPAAWAEISPDMDNVRQAWEWAVTNVRPHLIHQMARSLRSIYEDAGWLREGMAAFAHAVRALRAEVPHPPTPSPTPGRGGEDAPTPGRGGEDAPTPGRGGEPAPFPRRWETDVARGAGWSEDAVAGAPLESLVALGETLSHQGYFASRCGWFADACDLLQESLALLRQAEDEPLIVETLYYLGLATYQIGGYAEARALLDDCRAHCATRGDSAYLHGLATHVLGLVASAQGAYAEAVRVLGDGLIEWRASASPRVITCGLSCYSLALLGTGDTAAARAALQECLQISSANRDRWSVGFALLQLGRVALAQGETAEARYLCAESIEVFRELGDRWSLGLSLIAVGQVADADADPRAARRAYLEAAQLARDTGLIPIALDAALGMAGLLARAGRADAALEPLALVCAHPATDTQTRGRAEKLRAELAARRPARGAPAQARPLDVLLIEIERHLTGLESIAPLDEPPESASARQAPAGGGVYIPATGETLTPREVEVLRLLAAGASNSQIAERLVISLHTVKTHVAHILAKLNVASRAEAMLRARDLGIL
jgi:predicted ATPase/DNA-binding CsgD family transcriptional regulator/tetratricopeptide (TPR) repeat protein/DNA-binding XRE family transcriptional regulator